MADDVTPRPTADLAPIRALIARARSRLRLQGAFEAATTAAILAAAGVLVSVFLVRTETVTPGTGIALIVASLSVIVVGAVVGALGRLEDEQVARRIDRASGLADRLSSAIAFERALGKQAADDDETAALMRAAMRDAAAVVPRADVVAATRFRSPADVPVALAFAFIATLASLLGIYVPPKDPRVLSAQPAMAKRGAEVVIEGERLCGAKARVEAPCTLPSAMVYLGEDGAAIPAQIERWTGAAITITIPTTAAIGKTELVVWARGKRVGAVPFEVLDAKDVRNGKPETVAMDPDDEAYTRDLVAGLRDTARRDQVKPLEDYADKIDALLDLADNGELTKEELLQRMQEAQAELDAKMEQNPEQVAKDLAKTGEELKKNELTKELGAALEKGDLDKAKAEMEKLADKLAKGELSEQQAQELAKSLEKAAQDYEKKQQENAAKQAKAEQAKAEQELKKLEQQRQDAETPEARAEAERKIAEKKDQLAKLDKQQEQRKQQEQLEDEVRKLEKKKKKDAKTPEEQEDADRRLEKKKDELAELKKQQEEQDDKDQSAQREALKRLHKDMDKVAKQLQQKPQDGKDPRQQNQDNQKQASRSMKDVADETGAVSQDQRKQAAQKKVASQMEDLREAMRRAKQQGKQGQNNPFGKNGKQGQNQDFAKRASGSKPGQGNKPGQGQGQPGQGQPGQGQPGQGQPGQQNGGNGTDPSGPSDTYGDGHDNNLVGDATDMSGNTSDESVSGTQGRKGPSRRETILAAAQKGYASKAYSQVFAQYKTIVEEVMRTEKVPPSYKYYVKKYFTKIKPHSMQ